MQKIIFCFIFVLFFEIAFCAIAQQFYCFRESLTGLIQGVEDRIEKRKTQMNKSEKFHLVPINLRTHVQDKLKTFLDVEKSPKAFLSLEIAMEKAKNALMANPKYAKEALEKIDEMIDDIGSVERRIEGIQKLIDEHKNTDIRLTDLKGKKELWEIPEIECEVNEIEKFDILEEWADCPTKAIIEELLSEIRDFPKELAKEMIGRFLFKSAEFVLTKFLGIQDLFYMPKYYVYNCALLDLAKQLVQQIKISENGTENEALLLKIEKRVQLSSVVARLGTLDNEGNVLKKSNSSKKNKGKELIGSDE